jgi:hypothetical protein
VTKDELAESLRRAARAADAIPECELADAFVRYLIRAVAAKVAVEAYLAREAARAPVIPDADDDAGGPGRSSSASGS